MGFKGGVKRDPGPDSHAGPGGFKIKIINCYNGLAISPQLGVESAVGTIFSRRPFPG